MTFYKSNLMQIKLNSKLFIYLLISLIIFGFLGNYFFLFDLFSHFYLQYFVASSILLVWYLSKKYWVESGISVLLGVFLFSCLIGADFSGIYGGSTMKNPDMFYMNALYRNTDITPINEYIGEIRPRRVAMVELNEALFEKVKQENNFQYSYYYSDYTMSFGFFSDEEVLEQHTYTGALYPIGYFKTRELEYYVIHPFPPMSDELYQAQKKFFSYLSELLKSKDNFVLVGDFNSTVYSPVFRSHFWKYFYKPVYSWWVSTPLTIPIDYAISPQKLDVRPGKKLSSDHIPLLINF